MKVDGKYYEISEVPELKRNFKHNIDVVVDRLVIDNTIKSRLADSFELATTLTDGLAIIEILSNKKEEDFERILFSANYACPISGFTIEEIEPRLFSFNNPKGACKKCDGLGTQYFIDEELVIPDKNLSINNGAIAPWSKKSTPSPYYFQTLLALSNHYDVSLDIKWKDLPKNFTEMILHGSGNQNIEFCLLYTSDAADD